MAQRHILSGDPRLTGPLAGQGYGGSLAPGYAPDFSEADPAALQLNADPMRADYLGALRQALPQAAARYRVSQFQLGTPQPGLIHDVGYGYGGPVGGAVADMLPQSPRTGLEAGLMVGMPVAGLHYKGETFSGASHAEALEKLIAKHPEASAAIDANPDLMKVGIVRDGEFKEVSRLYPQAGDVGVPRAGLPMDYASRMVRANEQGFTTDVYHGTGSDIQQFENAKSVRSAYGVGTHVAEHPNLANVFASQFKEGGRVMPLKVDLGKIADGDTFKKFAAQHDWDMQATTDALRKAGYDSVKYEHGQYYNVVDGKLVAAKKGEDTAYAILDPKNIRSKAAIFDPKKRGSANIMHGLAGPIIGGAAATGILSGQPQQRPGT